MAAGPRRAPLVRRAASGFGTGIGLGIVLGVLAWVADELGYPWDALIPANAIGAWVGLAFLLGTSARTVPTGALRGVIGLLSAVAAYYVLNFVLGVGFRAIGAGHAATIWGAVALAAGPVFGAAGGTWRHRRGAPRSFAVAILAAILVAEGLAFGAFARADIGGAVLALEVVLGALLPIVLLGPGERLRGVVATAVLGLGGAAAIGPVTAMIRAIADRF